ncbi:hypothetical protein [Terricaulis silvestris]|uniref:Uncharacterized protein n=1 Tax=Terricaulis silvestris TaxID=2686094 RepID=A0A6I6MNA7_9CAUL|nr:hypothetical protein [Terricaulis silvestris]QGZ94237.1 hypothetical protein DSM104635_01053 [Terricaulis silvestris]
MRKDMSKLIVERPRRGRAVAGLRPGRSRALVDDDGEPIKAKGAREPKGREPRNKQFSDTLNPLKRYLASNVGRPWNKVYSEIAEHVKPTSTVQQHILQHVDDFVATKTRMKAGAVMVTPHVGGERALSEDWCLYYVHPRTGLLRKNDKYKRLSAVRRAARIAEEAARAERMRVIDAKTQAHLFGNDWWEVKLAKIGRQTITDRHGRVNYIETPYSDVVRSAKLSKLGLAELYGREDVYASEKRQLSKAEIKRLKLR